MVELIRMAPYGVYELRPRRLPKPSSAVGTINGVPPATVFGGAGTATTKPMRCCTKAKTQMHSSTRTPATMPAPQPICSNGRHRFADIGPLPRLIALLKVQP